MLRFNNVSKKFNSDILSRSTWALKNVSFEIQPSTVVGFLGANGAGKTTCLKIAMGFIPATSGEVEFQGLGKTRKEIFSKVGFLPERPYFYPNLTGREFCSYMATLSGMDSQLYKESLKYWAPKLGIEFALDRKIEKYSKGMLQRMGMLSSLVHDPELIILDEPLSGVDPIGRKELKDIIWELKNKGKTVFFSSHIVSDVEEICEKVVFLKDGEVHYQGQVDLIINQNIRPYAYIKVLEGDQIKTHKVSNEDKNVFLKSLLEQNKEIISVDRSKPTLEEIFYKTKDGQGI